MPRGTDEPKALSIGESEVEELLGFIAECRAVDSWPGYSNPDKWRCPSWYANSNREPVELLIGDDPPVSGDPESQAEPGAA